MENYTAAYSSIDRFDDGVSVNYSTMLRLWGAFDRSITAFNRNCGVIPKRRRPESNQRNNEREKNSR